MFRDDAERKAHDVICTIRHGGRGGNVRVEDVRKIADIIRGAPYRPTVSVAIPPVKPVPPPTLKVRMP